MIQEAEYTENNPPEQGSCLPPGHSWWRRNWKIIGSVIIVGILGGTGFSIFFTAPGVERVSGPIPGSTEVAPVPAQQLKPVAEPTDANKMKVVDTKKAEPAKSKASNEDAEDEAWLNGDD
ncbi:MAG: hypothetical protein WCO05_00665 [Candidatus Moraniibacteriota bacterium]